MGILNLILSGTAVFAIFGALLIFLICNLELDMDVKIGDEYYDIVPLVWFICTFVVTTVINMFYVNAAHFLVYAGGILVTYVVYLGIIEQFVPILFFSKKTLQQRFKIQDVVTYVNAFVLVTIIILTVKYKIYG